MSEPKISQLATIMIRQCLEVKPLDKVSIYVSTGAGLPLATAVFEQLIDLGALPALDIGHEVTTAYYYLHANQSQLESFPALADFQATHYDKFVQIIAEENTAYLTGVETEKMMKRAVIAQPIREKKLHKPWILTYFPTTATAQAAGMSLTQLEEFYYGAVLQDWPLISRQMTKLAQRLNNAQEIKIIGEETDLTLSVTGHTWNDTDWKCNLPGGEVFTTPVKTSAQGQIYFNYPLTNRGVTMENIRLTFEKGKVTAATASKNQAHLEKLLDTDQGSRFLGEIALGLNKGCNQYMDNVLFDEKMAGTIHLALGESFPECGLDNRSALHLDIIKNMSRPEDLLLADGRLILKGGQLVD